MLDELGYCWTDGRWTKLGRMDEEWLVRQRQRGFRIDQSAGGPKHRVCPLLAGWAPMGVSSSTGAPSEMHAAVKLEKELIYFFDRVKRNEMAHLQSGS